LLADLPGDFSRWSPLAQDQYLELRTLLAGYLLNTQGDRMLMAHSVEGRFPFLDVDVVDLAGSLPAAHKLRALDEKHVLKRAARDLVPPEILARKKQPYRAPDALSFASGCGYAEELLSEGAVRSLGVFDPAAVARLWSKCRALANEAQVSNSDNMALVGVLSTQLLGDAFVRRFPTMPSSVPLRTCVDRLPGRD
jgi:asparagine synthase (glutamine-hydrolysing)